MSPKATLLETWSPAVARNEIVLASGTGFGDLPIAKLWSNSWWPMFSLVAALVGLGGCGGGSQADIALTQSASQSFLADHSPNVRRRGLTASDSTTSDASALFDWAEVAYPGFFPSKQQNLASEPYVFRYYPETGNYVGLAGTGVWILGPVAGSQTTPAYVGDIADFRCFVFPSTCTDPIELQWTLAPTSQLVPGLVVDPDPTAVQDGGLNSSLVLRVSRSGKPVIGDSIIWSTNDASGQVQFLSRTSDQDGLVRAWYFAGSQPEQTITARHVWSGKSIVLKLRRSASPSPTVGRYAATYYSVPTGSYSAISINVVPRTAPERTYYALSSIWRTDGQFAMYGGLQMTDCSDPGPNSGIVAACATARGDYRGRLAIFSSWDWLNPAGKAVRPVLVNAPGTTFCQPFTHEGSGLQCVAGLDWAIGEKWTWTVNAIGGAPEGYQRVRVSATNSEKGISQVIATVDIAGQLSMDNFGLFNENWGGKPSPSCLDVELRKLTILSMGFWDGIRWVKPSRGQAMGGLYDESMTRCQNYAFTARDIGLDIASGGKGLWITLSNALVKDPTSGNLVFPNDEQVRSQWQELDLSTLVPMQ